MKTDGITTAFELISDEIENVASEIAKQGSLAFQQKKYDDAQSLAEAGSSLSSFREKVEALLEEWQAGIDPKVRKRVELKQLRTLASHTKSKRTRLRVTLPDGKVIEEYYAADTFVDALVALGLERIEPLQISIRGVPLVSAYRSGLYSQRRAGGKYVITHSSTEEKKDVLDDVARKLSIKMATEVIKNEK